MKTRIMIVEDDLAFLRKTSNYLQTHDIEVQTLTDCQLAAKSLLRDPPQILLLNIQLPGCRQLALMERAARQLNIPVIVITAVPSLEEKVKMLEAGAEDYLAKPVQLRELLARIRVITRHSQFVAEALTQPMIDKSLSGNPEEAWAFEDFIYNASRMEVCHRTGKPLKMTNGLLELLTIFVRRPNVVISRDEIASAMGLPTLGPFDRGIDVQISRLRQKLDSGEGHKNLIKSIRGKGYKFVASVARVMPQAQTSMVQH